MTKPEAQLAVKMFEDAVVGLFAEKMATDELRSPDFSYAAWKVANDEAKKRATDFGISVLGLAARSIEQDIRRSRRRR